MNTRQLIEECLSAAGSREEFWTRFISIPQLRRIAEIGIYRGDFAENMLRNCDCIEQYFMLDPWRNLAEWDKPANTNNEIFELLMQSSLAKTEFADDKRIVLRGKTTEVIDAIPDSSLDFAYIDGDHTLKGITIDLIRVFPKVKTGCFIGGDDFCPDKLQHFPMFEPTLVFPFAIYFAEAAGARIYTLPYEQFLIEKTADRSFELIDLAGTVTSTGIKDQILRAIKNGTNKSP